MKGIAFTAKEQELLNIVIEIFKLNEKGACQYLQMRLSGSLMLKLRGYKVRREATDIDIIVNEEIMVTDDPNYTPQLPIGFHLDSNNGASDPTGVCATNKDGVKIDFIQEWHSEKIDIIDGIPCGEVDRCLDAKFQYSEEDEYKESQEKHRLDLEYFEQNNELTNN